MSEDYIYYNIKISNEADNFYPVPAIYSENRTNVILNNPSEYELSVVRFRIPGIEIPIMYWKDNKWSITLSYDGLDVTEILQFISNGNEDKSIWNYQEFLDSVNQALLTAFNTLKTAKPGAPPTEAPFFTFDAPTGLISLNAEQTYDTTSVTPTIEFYMNQPLFALFSAFENYNTQSLLVPEKSHKMTIKNNYNNTASINNLPYYSTKQSYSTLFLFNDLVSFVFESDSIPLNQEKMSGQKDNVQRIITDFEPLSSVNDRSAFQFFPRGPLRYYDLKSDYPLSKIDVKVYWVDKDNVKRLIYIPSDDVLTIKLMFKKKTVPYEED